MTHVCKRCHQRPFLALLFGREQVARFQEDSKFICNIATHLHTISWQKGAGRSLTCFECQPAQVNRSALHCPQKLLHGRHTVATTTIYTWPTIIYTPVLRFFPESSRIRASQLHTAKSPQILGSPPCAQTARRASHNQVAKFCLSRRGLFVRASWDQPGRNQATECIQGATLFD